MKKSLLPIPLTAVVMLFVGCDDDSGAGGTAGAGGDGVSYESVQTDADGVEIAYTCTISEMFDGECYRMAWETGDGEEAFTGYGVPFGGDMLAVGYAPAALQHFVGAYRMTDTGLAGIWTNGFESGVELMGESPEPPTAVDWDLDKDPNFVGNNPDGSEYGGDISVAVFGTGPERGVMMTQHTGAESYQGRALYLGDHIVVVYQLGLELTVQYYSKQDDGTWFGDWYADGAPALGTETLAFPQ